MNVREDLNAIDDCLYRVAVKAIVLRDSKVLIGYEDNENWAFPGGGVDHGELPESALVRELHEELGLRSADFQVINSVILITSGQISEGVPKMNLFYEVKIDANATIALNNELTKIKWVLPNELRNLTMSNSTGDVESIIKFLESRI